MDLDSALYMAMVDDDITKHCHVNSNEDGDRFVGIKADSDNAMVYFPIGYQLPETDAEIRTDIKHLIQVLSEFTTKEGSSAIIRIIQPSHTLVLLLKVLCCKIGRASCRERVYATV